MLLRLLCCLALLVPLATAQEKPAPVAVEGTVTYEGPIPRGVPVTEAGAVRQLVEVHAKSKGLKDAVVWLEGVPVPRERAKKERATLDQQNFFFVPHVLAIEAGQEVEFLNSDSANHGVLASSAEPKNCFNVVTPPGGSYKHRFAAARRAVRIGCPYHAGMSAWVWVFEHPYYAVTDAAGRFTLPPVPPGTFTLQVRHLDGELQQTLPLTVKEGQPATLRIRLEKDGPRKP
jgi:plastocyanin